MTGPIEKELKNSIRIKINLKSKIFKPKVNILKTIFIKT